MNTSSYDAVALFSGGLDSILAARLVQDQGLVVKCLHFTSPFFGAPENIRRWQKVYGLDITAVDVGDEFAAMLAARPVYGFGKVLNPCIDCKILMMRNARRLMAAYGASIIVSGEVLGQRPMSQRRDALNVVRRDADVRESLLRPLSAKLLEETPAEASGRIDRARLGAVSGRGRKEQLALAEAMGITEIPTPAGGCRLTEKENGRSYWPVLRHMKTPERTDFDLANTGRQYWSFAAGKTPLWLCVGRNQADNAKLVECAKPGDLVFKTASFPGPVSLGRPFPGQEWSEEAVRDAAAFSASFSPKAVRRSEETGDFAAVKTHNGSDAAAVLRPAEQGCVSLVSTRPSRQTPFAWREYSWEDAKEEIREETKERQNT